MILIDLTLIVDFIIPIWKLWRTRAQFYHAIKTWNIIPSWSNKSKHGTPSRDTQLFSFFSLGQMEKYKQRGNKQTHRLKKILGHAKKSPRLVHHINQTTRLKISLNFMLVFGTNWKVGTPPFVKVFHKLLFTTCTTTIYLWIFSHFNLMQAIRPS